MESKGDVDIEAETELLNMIGTLDMVSMFIEYDVCVRYLYTHNIYELHTEMWITILFHEYLYTERRYQ